MREFKKKRGIPNKTLDKVVEKLLNDRLTYLDKGKTRTETDDGELNLVIDIFLRRIRC